VNKPEAQWIEMDDDSQRKMAEPARMLVMVFIQTLKAFRLYETDHPILTKFLDRVRKAFIRYFDDFEVFSLQVKETQILHRKKIVYENTDMKENLAFLFFRDGIREMRFHKGLEFNELLAFLNIVKKSDLINRLKDDLVTLIWQADFPHIDITTVEDFLESTGTAISADKGLPDPGAGFGLHAAGPGQQAASGVPAHALIIEGFSPETLPTPDQTLIEACQLNVQETDKINSETEQEENPDLVSLVDDLMEILLHLSEKMEAYENIIAYFEQVFLKFLEWGEVEKMAAILKNLNQLLETMALREKQVFAIRRILEIPSGPEHVRFLGAAIKGNRGDPQSTAQILRFLTRQAIRPLFLLYQELRPGKWKDTIKSHLIDLSREGIEPLAKLLPESKPSVILRIFDILKEVRHPSTLKHLNPLVHHDHREVREGTLKLVRKFEEKGRVLTEKFLHDPDPGIRGKAAIFLAQEAGGPAVKTLAEIIFSPDFHKRDYKEKTAFIRALGEIETEQTLSLLKKIAKKGRWFRREKWREMQRVAQMTLKSNETYSGLKQKTL
jgi:hypothetical protein